MNKKDSMHLFRKELQNMCCVFLLVLGPKHKVNDWAKQSQLHCACNFANVYLT